VSFELEHHWTLDPDVTFLNHGSFGATPRAVLEHQAELRARIERQPVKFFVRDLPALWDETRRHAASFVGANPANFVFVDNATTGVNAVLQSLELGPDDELLITDHEYNACCNVVRFVAERSGATVRVVELPFPLSDPDEVVQAIEASFSPRTRLLLVDHVTSQTGMVLPIGAIADRCREPGIEVLVDGAHAPGMIDLDVEALGVDYYTGNFHKWVCTPKSAAFLWVADERRPQIRPPVISHGANMPAETAADRLHVEFDWQGTRDPTPVLSVSFGIEYMGAIVDGGWPAVRKHNRDLALRAREVLNEALGEEPLCPDEMIGSLAAVRLPDGDPTPHDSPLYLDPQQDTLLFEHGIEVPIIPFPGPPRRLLRVSAQLYNAVADYRQLAAILRAD
jgi:isopenicillin-N epimerase